jgi:hypothetical protein
VAVDVLLVFFYSFEVLAPVLEIAIDYITIQYSIPLVPFVEFDLFYSHGIVLSRRGLLN